jgi:hypothetical protein
VDEVPTVWNERVQENAAVDPRKPYGVFNVERGQMRTLGSSGGGHQDFNLTIAVYVDQNSGADNAAIKLEIDKMMRPFPDSTTLRNGKVYQILPASANARFEPILRNSEDVLVCRSSWVVIVATNLLIA